MKKIITILISSLYLVSCDNENVKPGMNNLPHQKQFRYDNLRYFKDEKVNKCFAERGVGNTYSFTCVPCDSLVMAEINKTK